MPVILPHPNARYMFWLPPDAQPLCNHCGNTCEQWRCECCREVHCGYDSTGPIDIHTLKDGRKQACRDCADINIDDCAVRDITQAREILSDIYYGGAGELDTTYDNFERARNVVEYLGHAIEYLDRRTAEERGIGFSEFIGEMLTESLAALAKPTKQRGPNEPLTLPNNEIPCEVCREAHDYGAIYRERFGLGEVSNG